VSLLLRHPPERVDSVGVFAAGVMAGYGNVFVGGCEVSGIMIPSAAQRTPSGRTGAQRETKMTEHLTAKLRQMVEQEVRTFLGQAKLANLASADWIEQQARDIAVS
jgi:hypothetical protein